MLNLLYNHLQVVRALNFLQCVGDAFKSKWEAVSIPRGTLQVCWDLMLKGFMLLVYFLCFSFLFSNTF